MLTRRGLLGLAALGTTAALAGCGGGTGGNAGGPTTLRLGWWGNATRNQNTTDVIEAYKAAAADVTVSPEPGEWGSYWDRLATQVAANDAPDIVQMDLAYIREYGDRGALLDLAENGLDTSGFVEGTVDAGRTPDGLMGINAGVNATSLLVSEEVLSGFGIDLPDDDTWTWDQMRDFAASITEASGGKVSGMSGSIAGDTSLNLWLRQRGKAMYTEEGLGFEVADIAEYFTYVKSLYDTKAVPSASAVVEETAKSIDQQGLVTGTIAMYHYWSNQVKVLDTATGKDLTMLKLPTVTGNFADSQYYYKASMLWSASSRSDNPEAAVALINFLVNNEAAAKIIKAERGLPANQAMRDLIAPDLEASDKKSAAFLDEVAPGIKPAPIPPLVGNSTVGQSLTRAITEVSFGRLAPEAAAQTFVDEAGTAIQV